MGASAFDLRFGELPGTLPVFPLSGVLLLPRARLPLNIFEPRYLAMTREALASPTRLIGMIQPSEDIPKRDPPLFGCGCAGRIVSFSETDDGRYLITLLGVSRFRVRGELDRQPGGFRAVTPDWEQFRSDLEAEDAAFDRGRLVEGLKAYFRRHGISADWSTIEKTPSERLINSLSMICPFEPNEKQALLEAQTLGERAGLLTALVEMAVLRPDDGDSLPPQ
ncbi:LON peptidase substrate-binding domain-containing protein [Arenibaculum pallidiluteum]|uniref:LON peptidase substrate-binding domain-containing protein n=1 Tax=Arenibaculum pallidiluteum TaxID=2812559 RepID=UPI001A95AC3A|nr:LON peptidase substrate-binding domain-containing protein [Arenibaculum pallidiluteum]